jgi:vitamin B12 transporter
MRILRLWRPTAAAARRLPLTVVIAAACVVPIRAAAANDRELSGTVVDQSGQPLPRAYVRVQDEAAHPAATFADESGRFRLRTSSDPCTLEISLTGFDTANVACASTPLRVVLPLAPVHETVVVSATRTEAPADQVGASISAWTAGDIEDRQAPFVADLLRTAPGVMVVRSGGTGALTSLFVRGGESNYNKVLLDGIPLNEPGGTFDFRNLSTDNLERLELVRGAYSALFGSDAMASVVQIITRRPAAARMRPQGTIALEGGTFNTLRGTANASGGSDRFDYAVGVQRYRTDNQEPNSAFDNTTLSANLGITVAPRAVIRFIGRSERAHAGTPGQTAFERADLDAFYDRDDGVAGVSVDHQAGNRFRERAAYSLSSSNQQSTDRVMDSPYMPRFGDRTAPFAFSDFLFDTRTRLHRHHASYQGDWRLASGGVGGGHLVTVLADWDGERATLEDRLATTVNHAARDNFGWSIQHQALWPRLSATAGARVERNASFGTAFVPRGSIVFVARNARGRAGETKLRASAGLGVKEPTVLESFSPSPFFRGNPDLKPERARTIDAGIEQRLWHDRARIEAVWFASRFSDRISTRTTNPATFEAEYFNIGLSRAEGAELSADIAAAGGLRARGGYTLVASKVIESTAPNNIVLQAGNWMFRRPRHSGFVDATWARRRLSLDLDGLFVGEYVDSDFASLQPPLVRNSGYAVWNVRAAWKVRQPLNATLAIDNVGNADYMEPLGYPALRRAIRAGFRVGF